MRVILSLIIAAGIIWLFIPGTEIHVTEMGFYPGNPDPNIRATVHSLGHPEPWIEYVQSSRASTGRESAHWQAGSFRAILLHASLIGVPAWILFQLRRREARS